MGTRAVLAGASVVVAGMAALVTNAFTDGWAWPWGVAFATLLIIGAGLAVLTVTLQGRAARRVRATGAGSVATGGSVDGQVRTRFRGPASSADNGGEDFHSKDNDVTAAGAGAVAVGGDVRQSVETSVELGEESQQ